MKKLLILILLFMGCDDGASITQNVNNENLKQEALEFSFQFIESIITENYDLFNTAFSLQDSLYFLEPGELPIVLTQELIDHVFSSSNYIPEDATMDLFLQNHSPFVKTFEEMSEFSLEYWDDEFYTKPYWWILDDFIFFAPINETGIEIIWFDMLLFVVSKNNGNWYIKALSG